VAKAIVRTLSRRLQVRALSGSQKKPLRIRGGFFVASPQKTNIYLPLKTKTAVPLEYVGIINKLNFMKHTYVIFCLCLLSSVLTAHPEGLETHFGLLNGLVRDAVTQAPLPGVVVRIAETGQATQSDELGKFRFKNMEPGMYTITIACIGYAIGEIKNVRVLDNEATFVQVLLEEASLDLKAVVVSPEAGSNTSAINAVDINMRPINSSQDILRFVPGLFIAQHAGGGKAEQIFLRGFDIDHGTDVQLTVDGMPVNMVSHAHGQGYSDLHFVIPELVSRVDFDKGTYYADKGNFTTAGYVDFRTTNVLDRSFVKVEAGQFDTYRGVAAVNVLGEKAHQRDQNAYVAAEYLFSNSYFDSPQNFHRLNLAGKYHGRVSANTWLNVAATHFDSRWNHSGQIPDRAVDNGQISFYGAIDDTEGGITDRSNLNVQLMGSTSRGDVWKQQVYLTRYNFELFSNFTFFLEDSVNGDQIKQRENRFLTGYNGSFSWKRQLGGKTVRYSTGVQSRYDVVDNNELSRTVNRSEVTERLAYGDVREFNTGVYVDAEMDLSKYWTLHAGLRADGFVHRYTDFLEGNKTSHATAAVVSPKMQLYYTPSEKWRFYAKAGKSFHSNDTRVVVAKEARETLPAAWGADVGVVAKPADRLLLQGALWTLWLDQEFVYVGDAAVVEAGGRTLRRGFDLSARYQANGWLFFDADLTYSNGRSVDDAEGENYLPLAPRWTGIGGVSTRFENGINASLRTRWLGNRPANPDNSTVAQGYNVFDLQASYNTKRWEAGFSIQNLFNTEWKEAQFETETRLRNEPAPVTEICFTAGTKFFARVFVVVRF